MANTTNLNMTKLAGTEKQKTFPSTFNGNMDAIDGAFGAGFGVSGKPTVNAEINSLADGLAIISNNNTHAAITAGQFVYVRGHGSLSDGLYVATSNIAANGTLSGSNLTADSSGGLNTVYSTLNSNITKNKLETETDISSYNSSSNRYTIPSDGYITVINNSGASGYIIVQGNSGSQYFRIGGNTGHYSLFVRKGLKVYTNNSPTNAYYYELT